MAEWPPLREVIARHGLAARHSLGQHFLLDGNLTDRIVREAGDLTGRHVIEVGPGPGGLTRSLLASAAASVTAIELDRRAIGAMTELAETAGGRLRVIEGDALRSISPRWCRRRGRSSPTCPTMSPRRCWSAGCARPRRSSG